MKTFLKGVFSEIECLGCRGDTFNFPSKGLHRSTHSCHLRVGPTEAYWACSLLRIGWATVVCICLSSLFVKISIFSNASWPLSLFLSIWVFLFFFFFNTQLTKYMVSSRKYSLCSREFTEVVASSPHRSASLPPCGESGSAVWPRPIVKQSEFCTRTPQRKPLLRVPRAWIADRASDINVQTPQMGKESLHTANTNFIQRKESSVV